jgi:L-asparaginase/Glu-tRNA(Gln) amidotransferase subunit D
MGEWVEVKPSYFARHSAVSSSTSDMATQLLLSHGHFIVDSENTLHQQDVAMLVQGGDAREHNDLAIHSGQTPAKAATAILLAALSQSAQNSSTPR